MRMPMSFRAILTLASALSLGGCISLGSEPPPSLLTLTADSTAPAGNARRISPGDAITVLPPRVPAALANNRVPVQVNPTSLAYVKDAQWVDSPSRLFRALLAETITARTGRTVFDPRQSNFDPGVRLSGELQSFGIDAVRKEAVVIYDASRSIPNSAGVEARRFEARVPVAEIRAAEAGAALNSAANQVAEQVASWFAN